MTRTPAVPPLHPDLPASAVSLELEPLPGAGEPIVEVSLEGICSDCGDRISAARLKALPDAVRCVTCQRELEAHNR